MLLLNIDYIPGSSHELEPLGLVKGTVVQSKNFGKDFMAGMKTLVGGEITGYTDMLVEARQIATKRMVDEAEALGADAVLRLVRYHAGRGGDRGLRHGGEVQNLTAKAPLRRGACHRETVQPRKNRALSHWKGCGFFRYSL